MAIGCRYLVKKDQGIFLYLLDRNFLMGDPNALRNLRTLNKKSRNVRTDPHDSFFDFINDPLLLLDGSTEKVDLAWLVFCRLVTIEKFLGSSSRSPCVKAARLLYPVGTINTCGGLETSPKVNRNLGTVFELYDFLGDLDYTMQLATKNRDIIPT